MIKEKGQKIKLLKIWEFLCQDSDEQHPLDTINIIDRLQEMGISCDRKTLYSDIAELNKYGYTVLKNRSRRNQYYVKPSKFTVPELRVMIDAIQAANFITEKKTEEFVEKIANLGGCYRADILKNGMYFDIQKSSNEHIYQNIQTLDQAINDNKKVSFKYFNYEENGEVVYRREEQRYVVNPMAMVFNNNSYYLVCYSDKYKNLANYRIDRMDDVAKEQERIIMAECAKGFDIAEYRRKAFSMYTGEEVSLELEFDKSLIDVMMDKFGSGVKMCSVCMNNCRLTTNVQISPVFFGWCTTFGRKLRIVKPESVVLKYKSILEQVLDQYDTSNQQQIRFIKTR